MQEEELIIFHITHLLQNECTNTVQCFACRTHLNLINLWQKLRKFVDSLQIFSADVSKCMTSFCCRQFDCSTSPMYAVVCIFVNSFICHHVCLQPRHLRQAACSFLKMRGAGMDPLASVTAHGICDCVVTVMERQRGNQIVRDRQMFVCLSQLQMMGL